MLDKEAVFKYHVPGVKELLNPGNDLWDRPLMGEAHHLEASADSFSPGGVTIGDFFESAKIFLRSDEYAALRKGAAFYLGRDPSVSKIDSIDIFLEKHGAFYHPSKVEVKLDACETLAFVLNAAVSSAGLSLIEQEYQCLERLNLLEGSDSCIPRVFGMDILNSKENEIGFFLARWFQGFKEFHITDSPEKEEIALWRADGGLIPVPYPAYFSIFEQASRILTRLYNVTTFEQVFPWHHAAGDFVVKKNKEVFDVRLITVRRYASMVETDSDRESPCLEDIHTGLLFFLTNLSIRMRIDRINGTGEYCFFSQDIIPFILRGFFTELSLKKIEYLPEVNLYETFFRFLLDISPQELHGIFAMLASSGSQNLPETSLIRKNIKTHVVFFRQELTEMGKKCFFIDNT